MPSEPNLLPKARRPLATGAYPAEAMALYMHNFITSLPEPQEYDAILVMVVRFSKLVHMVPIVGTATALETT
jgi:hypothetical protein